MDDRNTYLYALLLLNVMAVSSYLQFVVPGVTQADSSSAHVSQFPSGPYPYWPNRTVDGNFSQNIKTCLHTAYSNVTEAWLRIDLQTVRSIKIVKFWYRNDRGSAASNTIRLHGYSIRVSNTSDVPPGSTEACFTDDMSYILPTVIQEECKRTARYVWFYQPIVRSGDDRVPILEICEVQIFGCEIGTYDVNCSKTCSHCKNRETCEIDSGECDDNGCEFSGFKSPMCSDCISGLYGNGCSFNCSKFCQGELCYHTTGECVNGCENGYIGGLCKTPCPNGHFGRKCLENCGKCLADQICNNVNGTCMDGCNKGFKGNLCKKGVLRSTQDPETQFVAGIAVLVAVNVSMTAVIAVLVVMLRNARKRNETNSQVNDIDMYNSPNGKPVQFVVPGRTEADSSPIHNSGGTYPYWPNRTVDGNFSQSISACLHTAASDVTEAWLRIDLQTVKSIKSVKFWYRNDRGSVARSTERLQGYSIRVSNTSNVSPGSKDACFTDDRSAILSTVIEKECERTARYVWFYQLNRAESQFFPPILEICEVQIFGCETGTYDVSCSKTCRHCKNSETCDIDTGECDGDGCALPGFKSPMCSECISGLYGNECNFNCSQFCHEQLCYQTTGECVHSCEDGYIGGLCKTRCPNGYFGRKCLETCGKCLDDQTCDNVNGTCMDGCNEGLKGDLCKTACSPGEYGRNCQFRCSDHCHNNEVCNPFFGNCSKCANGFQNAKCNEQCDSGYYGKSCMFQCGHCLDDITCNNINGTCPGGCMPGWHNTDKCDKLCRNGTFGVRCTHTCTGNCLNYEICNKSDGGCRNCAPGWEGHLCDKTCGIGKYGLKCQHKCGHCFKAEQCFHTNGSCSGGCMEGYRGEMCSESSVGSTQDPTTPYVAVIGILVVIIVVLITIIAVGVVILRNARKTNKANSKVNEIDMYDSPSAKPENNVYDVISTS